MLPKDTSYGSLLLALCFAAVLGSTGLEGYRAMSDKATAQAEAVSDFQDWKRQYMQLLPLEDKWAKALRPFSEAKDLYSLHGMLGDEPASNPDTLLVEKIERVVLNERDLGAQKVCLSSGSGTGVVFTEKDFPSLMAGLDKLAQRPDVQMGSIEFTQEKAVARAVVAPLCLLLRDDVAGKK